MVSSWTRKKVVSDRSDDSGLLIQHNLELYKVFEYLHSLFVQSLLLVISSPRVANGTGRLPVFAASLEVHVLLYPKAPRPETRIFILTLRFVIACITSSVLNNLAY